MRASRNKTHRNPSWSMATEKLPSRGSGPGKPLAAKSGPKTGPRRSCPPDPRLPGGVRLVPIGGPRSGWSSSAPLALCRSAIMALGRSDGEALRPFCFQAAPNTRSKITSTPLKWYSRSNIAPSSALLSSLATSASPSRFARKSPSLRFASRHTFIALRWTMR